MNKRISKAVKLFLSAAVFRAFFSLLAPPWVSAFCPVCTVAVGAGLGLSRWLGIDDSITGVWVGGLVVSLSLWLTTWVKAKKFKLFEKPKERDLTLAFFVFWSLITFVPLWKTGVIGHPFNTVFGMDKLIFGSILGAIFFLMSFFADRKVREIKGKQLFSFQKVVFPLAALLLVSLVLYFYGGYFL